MGNWAESIGLVFEWVLRSTVQVSVLAVLIWLIEVGLRRRLSGRWGYFLWLVLVVRMVMPWGPASSISMYNLMTPRGEEGKIQSVEFKMTEGGEALSTKSEILNNIEGSKTAISKQREGRGGLAEEATGAERVGGILDSRLRGNDTEEGKIQNAKGKMTEVGGWGQRTGDVWGTVKPVVGYVWLVGAVGLAGYIVVSSLRWWLVVRSKRQLTDQRVLELLEECKEQMGVRTVVGVVASEQVAGPAVLGFVRPRVLLPAGMVEGARDAELRDIFLHELAHIKRYDVLVGWVTAALQVVHWFNPLIWWAFGRMRAAREQACDAAALERMGADSDEARRYGGTIVGVLERFSQRQYLPNMAGILESRAQLKRRIGMIAGFGKNSWRWSAIAAVVVAGLVCVGLTNAEETAAAKVSEDREVLARHFVGMLMEENYAGAAGTFDATMAKAMPTAKLREAWTQIMKQAGPFGSVLGVRREKYLAYDIALVTCELAKGPVDVKVVYDEAGKVSGLWFVPTPGEVLKGYKEGTGHAKKAEGPRAPRVVKTYPAAFATDVSPLLRTIRVRFDQKMGDGSWSWTTGPTGEKTFPKINGDASYDVSLRVCNLPVQLEAGRVYYVGINGGKFTNFRSEAGVSAQAYALLFATKGVDGKPTPIPEDMIARAEAINAASDAGKVKMAPGELKKVVGEAVGTISTCAEGDRRIGPALESLQNADNDAVVAELVKYLDSDTATVRRSAIYILWRGGLDDIEPVGDKLLQLCDHSEDITRGMAAIALGAGKIDAAFGKLCQMTLGDSSGYARRSAAYALGLTGRADARETLEKALKDTDTAVRNNAEAALGMLPGPNAEAAEAGPVSQADKLVGERLAMKGWQLWRERKLGEAAEVFEQAVGKDPGNANAWNGLGWACQNQGMVLNAQEAFEKCLALEPKHAAALNGLGWIAKGQGDNNKAIEYWERAVAAAPNATAALSGLAQTYVEIKEYDKGLRVYETWLKVEPDNEQAKKGAEQARAMRNEK